MDLVIMVVVVAAIVAPVVGVAVLVGLVDRWRRGTVRDGIPGVLTVTSMPTPTMGGLVPNLGDLIPAHEEFVAEGIVEVPGREPYLATVREAAWTHRWPEVGDRIVVLVERDDPRRVRIRRGA